MFLATTAIEAFCDRSGPVLFLGAWCVPWAYRSRLVRPGDVIMPSVWDDRERFYQAAQYADACVERLLGHLTGYLDRLDGEPRGLGYWRVIVGPWLTNYVHAAYDRWAHLDAALGRYRDLETVVLDPASYRTPRTGPEALTWILDDAYNLQIYSQLLDAMGHRFRARSWRQKPVAPRHRGSWRLCSALERALVRRLRGRVGMTGMSLSLVERWRVTAATGGDVVSVPPFHTPEFVGPDAVFDDRRRGLAGLEAADPFERAIVAALPVNLPTLYLEGHAAARRAARETLTHVRVKALLSETDWYANEGMKYLAAEAAAGGTKLVTVQHGGGYGIYRFCPGERHERRIADRYLVWGWADGCPLRNWPSAALTRLSRTRPGAARRQSGILFVATAQSRYLHWFNSQPAGTQLEEYFEWQARFLAALPTLLHREMLMRPHPVDYGHTTWPRIAARFPDVARDGKRPFVSAIQARRLVVIDHCATAMLETFVANAPTVLFWNPARWEVRPSVQPFFDELRRLEMLHDDPERAARHVERVYTWATEWWAGPEIQAARRRFVERFALHRAGGVTAWAGGLAEELARA